MNFNCHCRSPSNVMGTRRSISLLSVGTASLTGLEVLWRLSLMPKRRRGATGSGY